MSGAPREASRSANSFSTSPRLAASQMNARAPVSLTSGSRSPVVRAASATLTPSLASARADDERGIEFDIRHGETRVVPLDAREASTAGGSIAMARFLIVLGLAILIIGLLWPYLGKLGLGRLPGDIVIERETGTIYVPLATCLLLSLLLSLVFWIANR